MWWYNNQMELLGKLFDSVARVKIIRLFLFNPETVFETVDVRTRSQVPSAVASSELNRLKSIGLIKQRVATKTIEQKKNGKIVIKKKRFKGWILDEQFEYLEALRNLLTSSKSFKRDTIVQRFSRVGKVKLLVISGIFIQAEDSRVDLLLVGDSLKKNMVNHALKILESEIGKDLRYTVLGTKDFVYRLGVYDKFVRDVFDYPHEKLVDKIGLK